MSRTKNTKSKTREKLPEGTGKTWSIRGVPNNAITAARLYSAQDEMFLGAWVGDVILREVAQRTNKNNKTEIAKPSDVTVDFLDNFKKDLIQQVTEKFDEKLKEQAKTQKEEPKKQGLFSLFKRGGQSGNTN